MYEIYMNIGNYQGKDFSNYEVSNLGNIRNAKTKKVLKTRTQVRNDGYTAVDVGLSDTNHKRHTILVSRLVISTFKANSENKPQVGHLNDDSTDNRLNNLYYTTAAENNIHNGRAKRVAKKAAATMKANGTYTKTALTNKSNGTYDKIANKRSKPVYCITNNTIYKSAAEAARQLNLVQCNITACCKNKQTHTGGYQFEYYTEGDAE